jgi:hypothetical protein
VPLSCTCQFFTPTSHFSLAATFFFPVPSSPRRIAGSKASSHGALPSSPSPQRARAEPPWRHPPSCSSCTPHLPAAQPCELPSLPWPVLVAAVAMSAVLSSLCSTRPQPWHDAPAPPWARPIHAPLLSSPWRDASARPSSLLCAGCSTHGAQKIPAGSPLLPPLLLPLASRSFPLLSRAQTSFSRPCSPLAGPAPSSGRRAHRRPWPSSLFPYSKGAHPTSQRPSPPQLLVVGARGGLLWRCLPVPWRPTLHSSPSTPLCADPRRYSGQQQPYAAPLLQSSLALSSTLQHHHCPCLSAVQIPATSLAEHCPIAACSFASRVGCSTNRSSKPHPPASLRSPMRDDAFIFAPHVQQPWPRFDMVSRCVILLLDQIYIYIYMWLR